MIRCAGLSWSRGPAGNYVHNSKKNEISVHRDPAHFQQWRWTWIHYGEALLRAEGGPYRSRNEAMRAAARICARTHVAKRKERP